MRSQRGRSEAEGLPRQVAIDQGKIPAETVRELVSALRQSVLAAYIECDTAQKLIVQGKTDEALEAIGRASKRIVAADEKMTLAMEAA